MTHADWMIGLNTTYHDPGEETHVQTFLAGDNLPTSSEGKNCINEKGKCKPRLQYESSSTIFKV